MTDTERQHWVTVTEAAALLGKSERTVWRYVKAGELSIDRNQTPHLVDVAGKVDTGTDNDSDVNRDMSDNRDTPQRIPRAGVIEKLRAENERLRAELEHRDEIIERLERELDRLANTIDHLSERSTADQIIMSQLAEAVKPGPSIWRRLLPWRSGDE